MKITISLAFLIISLFYSIILNCLFFCKKHIKTTETRIFGVLVFINLIGILLEICCIISMNLLGINHVISIIINKAFLIYFLVLLLFFSSYVINLAEIIENKISDLKLRIINAVREASYFLFIISTVAVCVFDIKLFCENGIAYSYGTSVNIVYTMAWLCTIGCFIYLITNFKNIKKTRNIPIIVFLVGMGAASIIQKQYPEITMATSIETLVIFLMYHTIENPDLQIIEQLQIAKNVAEKANSAKTDFLSSMSHEIRTPLNAIVGFSDCIATSETLEEAKENAKDIISASTTLLEIVNGILDISKIEAGKIEIVNAPYNPKEVFTELAKLITPRMNDKKLDFTYSIADDIPASLIGDAANLKKIVTNLLSNACKYTPAGFVRYEVNCVNSPDATRLIISVEDSGQGVKQENVDKLFTKFQRLESDKNAAIEGTGLGLAITKQLIELMGGQIIVHTVYGEGSKFTVIVDQKIDTQAIANVNNPDLPQKEIKTTLDLNNIKILLVDDNALNLKVGVKVLKQYGANMITPVDSGYKCVDLVKNNEHFDIILLDDLMPGMRGAETLLELKKLPGFNTPVIALTANALTGMREKYINEGFNDYLSKPLEKNQIIEVLNRIIDEYQIKKTDCQSDKELESEQQEQVIQQSSPVESVQTPQEQQVQTQNSAINQTPTVQTISSDSVAAKSQQPQPGVPEVKKIPEVNVMPTPIPSTPVEEQKVEEFLDDTSKQEDPVVNQTIEEPPKMDKKEFLIKNGVDMDKALELLGDMEMYDETINDFMAEVEEKWQKIENYRLEENMPDYAVEVHSLKSDARYLGFMKLGDIAYNHEMASKGNDVQYVKDHFNELSEEYEKTLNIIKAYLELN